jgi:diketogulonate reductase-like aldo/keto reductase
MWQVGIYVKRLDRSGDMRKQFEQVEQLSRDDRSGRLEQLNNGLQIPRVGLGVLRVGNEQVSNVVFDAIRAGYRLIDGAAGYENETGVGQGIERAIGELGIARNQLWITSKLRDSMQGYDSTLRAFEQTLSELSLDYLDMYMIHWPVPQKGLYLESWKAFERLHREGRIKALGVCNFLEPYLQNLLEHAEIIPAVNQLEIHPSFQQKEAVQFTKDSKIAVQAYSPIARGLDLNHDLVSCVSKAVSSQYNTSISPAQIILRWHLEKGNLIIPKTTSFERMQQNLQLFNFELTHKQIEQIDSLDSPNGSMGHDPHTYSYS